jgi:hypothetical protein
MPVEDVPVGAVPVEAGSVEAGSVEAVPVGAVQDEVWLTAMLRPAGELAGRAIDGLVEDIIALAQRANIVVVNLVAATVPAPDTLARALRRPGAMLSGPDKALLLVGADARLLRELRRVGGDVATMLAAP